MIDGSVKQAAEVAHRIVADGGGKAMAKGRDESRLRGTLFSSKVCTDVAMHVECLENPGICAASAVGNQI